MENNKETHIHIHIHAEPKKKLDFPPGGFMCHHDFRNYKKPIEKEAGDYVVTDVPAPPCVFPKQTDENEDVIVAKYPDFKEEDEWGDAAKSHKYSEGYIYDFIKWLLQNPTVYYEFRPIQESIEFVTEEQKAEAAMFLELNFLSKDKGEIPQTHELRHLLDIFGNIKYKQIQDRIEEEKSITENEKE